MVNIEAQKSIIAQRPTAVALTLGLMSSQADLLSEREIDYVRANAQGRMLAKFDEDPQFYSRIFLAQEKAKNKATSEGWWKEGESYLPEMSMAIVLEKTDSLDRVFAWKDRYYLEGDIREAVCMADLILRQRLGPYLVAVHGDDRDGGTYRLGLRYSNRIVADIFAPGLHFAYF